MSLTGCRYGRLKIRSIAQIVSIYTKMNESCLEPLLIWKYTRRCNTDRLATSLNWEPLGFIVCFGAYMILGQQVVVADQYLDFGVSDV